MIGQSCHDTEQSMGEEFRIERLIAALDLEGTLERCVMDGSWLTNDGRIIPIDQMSSLHIRNALNMLRRGEGYKTALSDLFIARFEAELDKRYPPMDPADERYDFP